MKNLFYRSIEERIMQFASRDEIIIIRGPRQAGKTTLMRMISEKINCKKEFVDLDMASSRNAISENPVDYVKRLVGNGRLALFLDEVQRLDNAGEIMKIIYDNFKGRVKIFASGSSSLEIKSKILGFLVGRAIVFELRPFSFGEFIRAKDEGLYRIFEEKRASLLKFIEGKSSNVKTPSLSDDFLKLWKEYLVFGGYPEVIKAAKQAIKEAVLSNLMDLYIEKDVATFFKIEGTKEFEGFVRVLAFNDSQVLRLSGAANDAGLPFYKAKAYLKILENTYVTVSVFPYYRNTATALRKAPKLYFFDLGFRNAILKSFLPYGNRDDLGGLAENFVFSELLNIGKEIRHWRTKAGAEMDFVLDVDGRPFPIEVKMSGSKAIGKSFYSFIGRYRPGGALIVTADEFSKREVGGTVIWAVPAFYI